MSDGDGKDSLRTTTMGLNQRDIQRLGADAAARVMSFRLILTLAQRMRTLMDARLRPDGLTTQQAALISVVDGLGNPALSRAAELLGTTHQNARQIADSLVRKGFLTITADPADGRVRRLATTERSRAYWVNRSDADQDYVLGWFDALSPDEVTTLRELLERISGTIAPSAS